MSSPNVTKPAFAVKINATETETLLSVSGFIDENAVFQELPVTGSKRIVFDMTGLKLLNSLGIRSWLLWIKGMEKADSQRIYIFKNCPRVMIDQINMVRGFIPQGAVIESFFVPYHCESCEHIQSVLYTSGNDDSKPTFMRGTADAPMRIADPEVKCEKCGSIADRDIVPTRYLAFLKYR